jgi:hypothetical protein
VTILKIGSLLKLPGQVLPIYLFSTFICKLTKICILLDKIWNKLIVLPSSLLLLAYNRKKDDGTYQGTTWKIKFQLDNVSQTKTYKLRIALATANIAELQVSESRGSIFLDHVQCDI